jgi:tol-pal system protein YbgF
MRRCIALVAAALLPACVSLGGGEDPLDTRLADVEARLARLERVAGGPAMLELSQRVDALESELRRLRGQAEVLENGGEALRRQQRDVYGDLERRLAALEARPGSAAASGAGAGTGAAVVAAPAGGSRPAPPSGAGDSAAVAYGRAFDALKAANYPVAIAGMKDFLARYPDHELADNAQYWLGEAYYVTRDYDNAIGAFETVGRRWPDSPKAADALLKLGFSQFELKRFPQARQSLTEVGRRHPGTEAARLAQERLKRIP